jgi:NAD-dependent SIR2 family protein deacetylase
MKETKENKMKCTECEDKGYFEDVVSEGLLPGDPYLEPHVERCDECKKFKNDEEAKMSIIRKEIVNEVTV